jgi:hypothetical protein
MELPKRIAPYGGIAGFVPIMLLDTFKSMDRSNNGQIQGNRLRVLVVSRAESRIARRGESCLTMGRFHLLTLDFDRSVRLPSQTVIARDGQWPLG